MTPWRIVFMGTPELACSSLRALLGRPDFQVIGVVTQPDKPKGREMKLAQSPAKQLALQAGVPVFQPTRARDQAFLNDLARLSPDLIAVVAYGQILPPALLSIPRFGCLNVHTSLLPKYRGAAPIQRALMQGDTETGVTIMKIDVGLDTGDILAQETVPIGSEDNSHVLHDRLAHIGAALLVKTIPELCLGRITPVPQDHSQATYASKVTKEEGRIDWLLSAGVISNRIRGLTPWPGAYTFCADGERARMLKILEVEVVDSHGKPGEVLESGKNGLVVACGDKALRVLLLQREGGKRLEARQFLAGNPIAAGLVLS